MSNRKKGAIIAEQEQGRGPEKNRKEYMAEKGRRAGRGRGDGQSVKPVVNVGGQQDKTTGEYGNDQHEDLSTKLQKGAKQSHPKRNGGRKVKFVATGKEVSSLKFA